MNQPLAKNMPGLAISWYNGGAHVGFAGGQARWGRNGLGQFIAEHGKMPAANISPVPILRPPGRSLIARRSGRLAKIGCR